MKCLIVAGTRPNFVKVGPIIAALSFGGHDSVLLHTGQHFDAAMSDSFFVDLGIPEPAHNLGVGSGTHAAQTARIMERFDPVLLKELPDWVVVVGDVNSTFGAAMVTAKRRPEIGCRLAHVEAGLRSGDWSMPEEVNRVLTDQVSDLLLTHSPDAIDALRREGIALERVRFVGNVMIDSLFPRLRSARERAPWIRFGASRHDYGLVTLHRPSNVDDDRRLTALVGALSCVSEDLPLIWPIHPRTRARLDHLRLTLPITLQAISPLGYIDMTGLLDGAAVIMTDSGGLQEESTALGVPCVTLRESTERPITCEQGSNRLIPWPPSTRGIIATVASARAAGRTQGSLTGFPAGWDGQAASRIVNALITASPTEARSSLPARTPADLRGETGQQTDTTEGAGPDVFAPGGC